MLAFAMPRFNEGEFGGTYTVGTVSEKLPRPTRPPVNYPDLKFWLVNVGPKEAAKGGGIEGLMALYKVCVHLGCLYAWVDSTVRFECPCHGSKYQADGTYIEGPAPRDLDRFRVVITDGKGTLVNETVVTNDQPRLRRAHSGSDRWQPGDQGGYRHQDRSGQASLLSGRASRHDS